MSKSKEAYIEEVSLALEQSGMQRMAGRVLAALLVTEPAEQTAEELADVLQASRGSISGATRYLIQLGVAERVSKPGKRRDYFRNKPGAWLELMKRELAQLSVIRELAEQGLGLLTTDDPEAKRGLEEMRDFYEFAEREFPALLERWKLEQHPEKELTSV